MRTESTAELSVRRQQGPQPCARLERFSLSERGSRMHSRVVFPVLVCTAACSSTGGGSADAGSIVPLDDASVVGQSCDPVEAFRSLNPLTGNVRVVERCRDDGWCLENEPQGSTLEAAWAVHDDDVWAVGHTLSVAPAGVLLHWDGRHGDAYDIALPSLHAIWGSRSDDVWAVAMAEPWRTGMDTR